MGIKNYHKLVKIRYLILIIIIAVFTLTVFSNRQHTTFGNKLPMNDSCILNKFIPKGYIILDSISGNLNGDALQDMILVLKKEEEDTFHNEIPKRLLIILSGLPNHNFKPEAINENAIYCYNLGGVSKTDPYDNIKIADDLFMIQHSGGMGGYHWKTAHSFKYVHNENKWYLFKMELNEMMLNFNYDNSTNNEKDNIEIESDTISIKTDKDFGKIAFENFDIYQEDDD